MIKLLILTLSYIQLINFITLKILLFRFRDALLKSKKKDCTQISVKRQQYVQEIRIKLS